MHNKPWTGAEVKKLKELYNPPHNMELKEIARILKRSLYSVKYANRTYQEDVQRFCLIEPAHPLIKHLHRILNEHYQTGAEIAKLSKVHQSTLCHWFIDGVEPRLFNFLSVIQHLGYDLKIVKREHANV